MVALLEMVLDAPFSLRAPPLFLSSEILRQNLHCVLVQA